MQAALNSSSLLTSISKSDQQRQQLINKHQSPSSLGLNNQTQIYNNVENNNTTTATRSKISAVSCHRRKSESHINDQQMLTQWESSNRATSTEKNKFSAKILLLGRAHILQRVTFDSTRPGELS